MNTYTLLIWEIVPEQTELYLIPNDVADKYRSYLTAAHHKLINASEMNEGLAFLNAATCKKEEYVEADWIDFACVLSQYRQDQAVPIEAEITKVYLSGFML